MKPNFTKKAAKVTLFAAALLATCLFAGSANAQSLFSGKFTLQHTTRWGKAVLPAGNYDIRLGAFDSVDADLFVISDANSGRTVARETCSVTEDAPENSTNALLIGGRANQQIVHSFRVPDLGKTCIYNRSLASRPTSEAASNAEVVPVLVASARQPALR